MLPLAMLSAASPPRLKSVDVIAQRALIEKSRSTGNVVWFDECDSTEVLDFNLYLSPESDWSVAMPDRLKPRLIYPIKNEETRYV